MAASLNLYSYGRITGLSGIFYTVSTGDKSSGLYWKFSFMCGLLTFPVLASIIFNEYVTLGDLKITLFDTEVASVMNLSLPGWILGGFLVGVGTKMGNGCTSGHGVCGIPRGSIRSIVATCLFMAAGVAMATLRYYQPLFNEGKQFGNEYQTVYRWVLFGLYVVMMIAQAVLLIANYQKEWLLNYSFGLLFGFGLLLSGMCRISKIQGFLVLN